MNLEWSHVGLAFLLTLLAGLSTGIGSAVALLTKRTSKKFLSVSLGFSAGVMIYVSFVEIYPQAQTSLEAVYDSTWAALFVCIAFFAGMGVIALIDKLIPSYENPHELKSVESMYNKEDHKLMRMGVLSAVAIFIHNFPEGLATFISGLGSADIAYPIAFAIGLHNIPEGIAVSVPLFFATGNKKKAFTWSFLSGLSEPVGGLMGFALLYFFVGINQAVLGFLFAFVSGIMVFISFDELLPTAKEYGAHHLAIYGLIAGMAVMALSLVIL
ncbi:MAG: zinc transporter ZupT [Bacteroidales bacterium]